MPLQPLGIHGHGTKLGHRCFGSRGGWRIVRIDGGRRWHVRFVGGSQGVPSGKSLRWLLEPPSTDLSSRTRLVEATSRIGSGSHRIVARSVGKAFEQLVGPVHAERSALYLGSLAGQRCDRTGGLLPF